MFGIETYKKIKTINRLRHILVVFCGAGFSFYIHQYGLGRHVPNEASALDGRGGNLPKKFRLTLEKLGPVFVKFGQILSTRWDLLPPEYIAELEKLQTNAPEFSYGHTIKTIEKEFGKPIRKVFKTFATRPFAAASLGQVYRATLHTGEEVAVKIQRPHAKEDVELDTRALIFAARLAEKYLPNGQAYNLVGITQEFKRWTTNELDYRKEATNCEVFDNFFKDNEHIKAPKVYWEYCNQSVLTMEYIEGQALSEILKSKTKNTAQKKQLVQILGDGFLRQYFEFGYFHADPHPGNILVLENNQVVFLDFGMVGFLDERLTTIASSMFLALMQKDVDKLVALSLDLHRDYNDNQGQNITQVNANGLRKELNQLVIQRSSEQSAQFTRIFFDLLNTAIKFKIAVPVDLVMLSKSLLTLDVVVTQLSPGLNLESWEQPLVEHIVLQRLSPKKLKSKAENAAVVADDIIKRLPESTAAILNNLETGNFGTQMNHVQLEEYEHLLNQTPPSPGAATLLTTIVIASALTYLSPGQPTLWGWPVSQVTLYVGIIGILFLIIKHRRTA